MTLRPGEVVLIRIDFHQTAGGKLRPAVVRLDSGDDDFVAAPVTSRPRASDYDVAVQQWRDAGLNIAATIRIHKLTVLAKDEIVRRVGELSQLEKLWQPLFSMRSRLTNRDRRRTRIPSGQRAIGRSRVFRPGTLK